MRPDDLHFYPYPSLCLLAFVLILDIAQALGAPVVSTGGPGTFDGVFLIGVIAVLLAAMPGRPRKIAPRPEG